MQHLIETIADYLDNTPEATAPFTKSSDRNTVDGSINRHFFNGDFTATMFAYYINTHRDTITVDVTYMGTTTRVALPTATSPELVARAAMNALHSTIDTLNGTHPAKAAA